MTDHDDDLRARLSRLDPAPASEPVDPSTSPRARKLLERVVETPVQETEASRGGVWRKPAALVAAAAVVVGLGVGVAALVSPSGESAPKPKAKTTLALKVAGGNPAMSMCMVFDAALLKDYPLAFGATATAVADGTVTLTVDRWYKGGTAAIVTLSTPGSAALDGVDFAVGKQYLVTASDGTVSSCGYSGESTPDLAKAFTDAFGA